MDTFTRNQGIQQQAAASQREGRLRQQQLNQQAGNEQADRQFRYDQLGQQGDFEQQRLDMENERLNPEMEEYEIPGEEDGSGATAPNHTVQVTRQQKALLQNQAAIGGPVAVGRGLNKMFGLEDPTDLIADLEQGLAVLRGA